MTFMAYRIRAVGGGRQTTCRVRAGLTTSLGISIENNEGKSQSQGRWGVRKIRGDGGKEKGDGWLITSIYRMRAYSKSADI